MENVRKYVEKFFKTTKRNIRYSMSLKEGMEFVNTIRNGDKHDGIFVVSSVFDYGYVKGYKAAIAEMKKGGAA